MHRTRAGTRRFSLVKLETPSSTGEREQPSLERRSLSVLDDGKSALPTSSPNMIQKLLFRQFSPKTRPCSMALSVSVDRNGR